MASYSTHFHLSNPFSITAAQFFLLKYNTNYKTGHAQDPISHSKPTMPPLYVTTNQK